MKLRVGDWVEVRSKEEILSSLDAQGRYEGLPFMPQMFSYCGQRFQVFKRAHKACDTVTKTGNRRLPGGVHLNLRCDGEAHGGCQAYCLIFWKDAWLKPVGDGGETTGYLPAVPSLQEDQAARGNSSQAPEDLLPTVVHDQKDGEPRYLCQATELPTYTTLLPWWDPRQYLEDYTSGNVGLGQICSGFAYSVYHRLLRPFVRTARLLIWVYDKFQAATGGIPYPERSGTIPAGQATPTADLKLQPGELVRVKSYEEILATVDTNNNNRGLNFDVELVPYCGGTYRVKTRVTKFIDETSGRMVSLKTPAIILEEVWCRSRYSQCRLFCPRSIYSWWREVWLERVDQGLQQPGVPQER